VGIDVGTNNTCVFALKNDIPFRVKTFKTEYVKENPHKVVEFVKSLKPDVVACAFGYGLPVKSFADLSERDISLLTLNFDQSVMGVRKLINEIKNDEIGSITFTIPAVINLPTVPEYRKLNRIDMGTSDKLCSTALAVYQLKKEGLPYCNQNFVLVESGYGFNAFIAVKNGKVVDGLGGTLSFPSFSSLGALDFELAYLLKDFPKSLIFKGGIKSYLEDKGIKVEIDKLPDYAIKWLFEFILKGIKVMEVSLGTDYLVVLSGVFFDLYYDEFLDYSGLNCVKLRGFGLGKQSAEGASIIANGLAGGVFWDLVNWLEIRKAEGNPLKYITSDLRRYMRIK